MCDEHPDERDGSGEEAALEALLGWIADELRHREEQGITGRQDRLWFFARQAAKAARDGDVPAVVALVLLAGGEVPSPEAVGHLTRP